MSVFQNGGLYVSIAIFVPKWARGDMLDEGNSISVMAMVYYIFISINMICYWALTNFQVFLAVVFRTSQIFYMPEYTFKRNHEVKQEDVKVHFDGCDFSWGFKVKQKTAEELKAEEDNMKKNEYGLKTDEVKTNILNDINVDLKSGDFLTVVGQVGCGKTSLLYSVMEETIVAKGKSEVAGSIAYVEQEPFIISDSVENNIRFGVPFDQKRMDEAVKYSLMESDL